TSDFGTTVYRVACLPVLPPGHESPSLRQWLRRDSNPRISCSERGWSACCLPSRDSLAATQGGIRTHTLRVSWGSVTPRCGESSLRIDRSRLSSDLVPRQ